MKSKILIVGICALIVSGCATVPSPSASKIYDADEQLVSNCKFIGNVNGTSGWGNLAASTGINNAKNEAREQAAQLKATHIFWTAVNGGYSPNVSGNAYFCK